jgi:hypothetical protein
MDEQSTHIDEDESVAADRLKSAAEIAAFRGGTKHEVYKDWAKGRLEGCWKDGGILYGSKRAIRRAHNNRARTGK